MGPQDLDIVTQQLGRPPAGALEVAVRGSGGLPLVIQVNPLNNGIPFPTLFWLSCPELCKKISHLEREGLIKKWERDQILIQKLERDHHRYRNMRVSLLQKLHPEWHQLPAHKQAVLKDSGIGGIRDFTHIKCLHLHYAHFLVDANVVGERLHALLS